MIRYSQAPKSGTNAVTDDYKQEKLQEQNKNADSSNVLETKNNDVDEGSDN